jgi:hypothetical protein
MSDYEFKDEENKVINGLTKNIYISCFVLVISGALNMLVGALDNFNLLDIVSGLAIASIGISLFFPTDNFKAIVKTQGKDIKELLMAFSDLKKGWLIVNIVTFFWLLLTVLRLF